MINFNDVAEENTIEHKANWPKIFVYPHWILIIGASESGKTIALLNLMNLKPNIDKTYLYVNNYYKAKYIFSINKGVG